MGNIKSIYEFLLWANCENNCKFCWQKHLNKKDKFLNVSQKLDSIRAVERFLLSDKYEKGSHVLLVGGELFDTKSSEEFQNFLSFVANEMASGNIELLYLNTNLIYENLDSICFLLDKIKDKKLFGRLKFTTSFDIFGRFSDNEKQKLMLTNLKKIKALYPEINIVVNIILTKQACEVILENKFSILGFRQEYSVEVNTIPYIVLTNDMAADKQTIFKTLVHLDKEMPGYLRKYVENFDLPQKKLLYEYTAGDINDLVFCSSDDDADCGHSINFKKYSIEQDSCFVCDIKKLLGMVEDA